VVVEKNVSTPEPFFDNHYKTKAELYPPEANESALLIMVKPLCKARANTIIP
jgi:hypothetical protein